MLPIFYFKFILSPFNRYIIFFNNFWSKIIFFLDILIYRGNWIENYNILEQIYHRFILLSKYLNSK